MNEAAISSNLLCRSFGDVVALEQVSMCSQEIRFDLQPETF